MRATLLLVVTLVALPLAAEERGVEVSLLGTWTGIPGERPLEGIGELGDSKVDFDTAYGYGAALNVFLSSKLSLEVAASTSNPRADLIVHVSSDAVGIIHLGRVRVTPVTAALQYHFSPVRRFDWYVSAGAAFVSLERTGALETGGFPLEKFDFNNDPGLVLGGGASYEIAKRLALTGDVKVVPLRSSGTATFSQGSSEGHVVISPVIASAGISYRF